MSSFVGTEEDLLGGDFDQCAKIQQANSRLWLKSHAIRWAKHSEAIKQLPVRPTACDSCPFGPGRSKYITDEMMAVVNARIADGEHWVCHQTHDAQGELTPDSLRCAAGQPS
jgi:hypothetical protein